MGLDTYLYGYISLYPYKSSIHYQMFENIKKTINCTNVESEHISIQFELAYWRKSYAIHNWFVSNIQNDKDDFDYYDISRTELQSLLETVNKVLENRDNLEIIEELLPQTNEFYGIDYYYGYLTYTQTVLTKILENETFDYYKYRSSW